MKFKEPDNKLQFFSLHNKLMTLICSVNTFCIDNYEVEPTITSMIRVGDPGVHGDARGCDFRSWDFKPEQIQQIVDYANKKFPYGDGIHPTCLYHDAGLGVDNLHLHFQVMRDGRT
jgi:hypothetical protein